MELLLPPTTNQYFRFQPKLERNISLDASDKDSIREMHEVGQKLIEDLYSGESPLNKVIETLLEEDL